MWFVQLIIPGKSLHSDDFADKPDLCNDDLLLHDIVLLVVVEHNYVSILKMFKKMHNYSFPLLLPLSIYLFICLFIKLSIYIYLSIYLKSIYLSINFIDLSIYLSAIYLYIFFSFYVYIYICIVYLFIYMYIFPWF